jgi:uncharacterized protein YggE
MSVMGKATSILLLCCFITFTLKAQSPVAEFTNQNLIKVEGEAIEFVFPDNYFFRITIKEKDLKNKTIEQVEQELRDSLMAHKIDPVKRLLIYDLLSDLDNGFLKKPNQERTVKYRLQLNKNDDVSKVLKSISNLELSDLQLFTLENSMTDSIKSVLRNKAILKAKKTADELASALNQNVGKAVFISEKDRIIDFTDDFYRSNRFRGNTFSNSIKEEALNVGRIKVEVIVEVHFLLE